jgi:hypothetical protein
MKIFADIQKVDDELKLVYGYASTEALDSQREIVTRKAIEAALPAYMKFANVREMHKSSAVGIAQDAQIDEKGLYLTAKVVDPTAWEKVKAGVYKGFSIGGRATSRDPDNKFIITGMDLTEISLVDRPANAEAVFDFYKVDDGDTTDEVPLDEPVEVISPAAGYADAASVAPALQNQENISTEKREGEAKEMAGHFEAMEDGSFPIRNKKELQNAIKAIGRAKDQTAAKAHIKTRAKELNMESLIPDTWKVEAAGDLEKADALAGDSDMMSSMAAQHRNTAREHIANAASMRAMGDEPNARAEDARAEAHNGAAAYLDMAATNMKMIGKAEGNADVEKRGARLSAEDQKRMDTAHDSLVMAGANCPGMGSEKADLDSEITKATDTLSKRVSDLEVEADVLKAERDVLDAEKTGLIAKVDSLKAEVEALKKLPADYSRAPVLKAVDKGDDVIADSMQKKSAYVDPLDDKWFGFNPNGNKPSAMHQ